jgi:hypothetical protein
MVRSKLIRHVFVGLALLGLLLLMATFGGALHHHQNSDSSGSCPICHLNHQPIERSVASDRLPVLLPAGPGPEPLDYEFASTPMTQRVPTRAPPSL